MSYKNFILVGWRDCKDIRHLSLSCIYSEVCYSPDLNPIEKLFSKLKTLLRRAAMRTADALWNHIGNLLDAFSPEECRNYFTSSGYVSI